MRNELLDTVGIPGYTRAGGEQQQAQQESQSQQQRQQQVPYEPVNLSEPPKILIPSSDILSVS